MEYLILKKVAVIVPVYNCEAYIDKSIHSLMNQTLSDVEFIIIDDGSTDNSLNKIYDVILKYPEKVGNVKVIFRDNKGVAATRSEGLLLTNSEYIIHFDSDDWVEPTWLEELYNKAILDSSDIVVCNYRSHYNDYIKDEKQNVPVSGPECVKSLLLGNISNSCCDKLVHSSIYKDNQITFIEGVNMGEDFYVSLRLFFYSKKISHVSSFLYNYNKTNNNSLTSSYSYKSLTDLITVIDLTEKFICEKNHTKFYGDSFLVFKLNAKCTYVEYSNGSSVLIKDALKLYPEVNSLIRKGFGSNKLRLFYYLNLLKLNFAIVLAFKCNKFIKNCKKKNAV